MNQSTHDPYERITAQELLSSLYSDFHIHEQHNEEKHEAVQDYVPVNPPMQKKKKLKKVDVQFQKDEPLSPEAIQELLDLRQQKRQIPSSNSVFSSVSKIK